jgi:hypothetical protein
MLDSCNLFDSAARNTDCVTRVTSLSEACADGKNPLTHANTKSYVDGMIRRLEK